MDYNFEADGVATLRSFRRVVRDRTAHCIEGALTAATILGQHGHRPRILCMEARDIDHIIFPFIQNRRWGSIAQSRDPNLKGREPKYKTVRDLVHSYHPHYWNYFTGDRSDLTLRGFALFQLSRIRQDWQTAEEDLWVLDDMLYKPKFHALFPNPGQTHFRSNCDESITWL